MLHFLLIENKRMDNITYSPYIKIGKICNFREKDKRTVIYIPESIWNGYGAEFLPLNIRNFPLRLMDYAKKKYDYEPKNFIIAKDEKTVKKLLLHFHSKGELGCVIGVLECFMKYVYASKERTKLNTDAEAGRGDRNSAKRELGRLQGEIIKELSVLSMYDDSPVVALWLGYEFKYVNMGVSEKRRKVYLYKMIKELGKLT